MISWFEKAAPIRAKFNALLYVHGGLAAISLLATYYAMTGGGYLAVAISAKIFLLTALTVFISGKLICDPYVNTVLRMEALATGDTKSPIMYTDHGDCVGRMTKAMAVFRDNADKVARSAADQALVVTELARGLEKLESGDLAHRISTGFSADYEELRTTYNRAVRGLDEIMGKVSRSSSGVHAGSSEIRTGSEDLSRRTEQQAASLEETSAAMTQVAAMVSDSARNAADIRTAIGMAHADATEGGDVVGRAVGAMDAIEKSSQEISQIINVIDGIAFQTNLLALNAGVEAARAGSAGQGFAVVANEVRALAQRSADAAREIKNLINASSLQVQQGVSLVGDTGTVLERIAGRIGEINGLITEMAASTEMQAVNVQQVSTAVKDMDRMTQQNAAMVEETTAAARSLADEADQLASLVARLRLSETPAMAPVQQHRRAMPAVSGNLALKATDDWAEF